MSVKTVLTVKMMPVRRKVFVQVGNPEFLAGDDITLFGETSIVYCKRQLRVCCTHGTP